MSSLYVHIPFCRQRCTYCDFYFVTGTRHRQSFVGRLIGEIASTPDRFRSEPVETVYFGGGTPSRLSTEQLSSIAQALQQRFKVVPGAEWTIEVNPEDSVDGFLDRLREIGFNRLSIGVQSLRASDLVFMRRSHTVEDARLVVRSARAAGFAEFSIDLIFGLPDQTLTDWMRGVEFAVEEAIPHVSTYGLTVEPRTLLGKWVRDGQQFPPDDELMAEMYLATIDRLSKAGYRHYEISNFALPGSESHHNSAYWNHTNYLGFGPSAHSFWWTETAERWSNWRSLRKYLGISNVPVQGDSVVEMHEELDPDQLASERIMLGLRTADGVSRKELRARYSYAFSETGEQRIAALVEDGLLSDTPLSLQLTPRGRVVADSVSGMLCDERSLTSVSPSQGAPDSPGA